MTLFDTSALIAFLRDVEGAADRFELAAAESNAMCSVLSRVEVEGGMRSAERSDVARMFDLVRLLPVTDEIARRAGEFHRMYRRSHSGIDVTDYVIAATAQVYDAELVTLHVKHFPMFKGLKPAL